MQEKGIKGKNIISGSASFLKYYNAISEINSSISALLLDKQDLLKLKDVDKIKEQITAKNESKAQIKKEMEKDLSNITYKGLFLCITNDIDVYESKGKCFPFPKTGEPVAPERCAAPIQTLMAGIPRNFEVFVPLDFLAEVTQHIPNKGGHQIRYYGWYSNKKRGMQEKKVAAPGQPEPDNAFRRKCRMTWAALIKCVYEVDPLKFRPRKNYNRIGAPWRLNTLRSRTERQLRWHNADRRIVTSFPNVRYSSLPGLLSYTLSYCIVIEEAATIFSIGCKE